MTKTKTKNKALRLSLTALGVLVALLLTAFLGYFLYLLIDYERIEDNLALTVGGSGDGVMATGVTYTALAQNIGFGAYTPDFSFFMDGGTESRAASRESVIACTEAALRQAGEADADLYLFQEVDTDSDRSYHVDQSALLAAGLPQYANVFAVNYHSSYLFYPFLDPHGASNSGLMTFSRFTVTSALRRSFPIATSLAKLLDLDRCYSVTRIPVEGGRELVVYNVHSSAYGGSDEIRTAQMTMLLGDMQREYLAGNYCVAGGDFNHDFTGDSTLVFNGEASDYGWAQPFPTHLLPEGIRLVTEYEGALVPTCRNCDVPYGEDCMTLIVDGFIVSENVKTDFVRNVDTGFAYSDHNPVLLGFTLLPQ